MKKIILLGTIVFILAGGYFVYQNNLSEINKVYFVDGGLTIGDISENEEVVVSGRYNVKLVSAGSGYEGPGGGDYLFGDSGGIHLNWKEVPKNIEYNDKIKVKGKIRYCGGDRIPKYICGLIDVELVGDTSLHFEQITLSTHNWEGDGFSIKIEKDGSYIIDRSSMGVGRFTSEKGKISEKELYDLNEFISSSDIFSLDDEYIPSQMTRKTVVWDLILETGQGSKSIKFYLGGEDERAPQFLSGITERMKLFTDEKFEKHDIHSVKFIAVSPFAVSDLNIGSGVINYQAVNNLEETTERETVKISKKQFTELTELIEDKDFWFFEEEYVENISDATTYIIEIDKNGYDKSVSCTGERECPSGFVEVMDKIRDLWGNEILEVGV